jgi:RNA polymerase sigma-70 factor (ECF subfamily)
LERRRVSQTIQVLADLKAGDASAASRLLPIVYEHLRAVAGSYFRRSSPNQTLQPTALVHEAFLRLVDNPAADWKDRAHFCAVCATAMRSILTDHARARNAAKRGGGWHRITLSAAETPAAQDVDLEALAAALDRLEALNPRQARLIELRFFGGLSMDQIALHLDVSKSTIESDWRMARAWLSAQLSEDAP